jgi:NAD/NADP transhydrogenase alpha subunit
MRVGVAREAKRGERRVALTPAGARELHRDGHEVLVDVGACRCLESTSAITRLFTGGSQKRIGARLTNQLRSRLE